MLWTLQDGLVCVCVLAELVCVCFAEVRCAEPFAAQHKCQECGAPSQEQRVG